MPVAGDLINKLQGWVDEGGHPEDPPSSNLNDIVRAFVDWSGWQWMLSHQPWCDAGLCEAAHEIGLQIQPHASCLSHIDFFRNGEGQWLGFDPGAVRPGDTIFYGPNGGAHVETVKIPGATGAWVLGCNARDAVRYVYRPYKNNGFNGGTYGFGRLPFDDQAVILPPAPDPGAPEPATLQASTTMPELSTRTRGQFERETRELQAAVGATIDGDFGPNTKQKLTNVQVWLGRKVLGKADGVAGPRTWDALLQLLLNRAGAHDVVVDGDLGPVTTNVLAWFQGASGLAVDAVAGPDTFGALTGQ